MVTPAVVLALDLGTSSVRALGCDAHGEPVDGVVARRSVHPRQDDGGAGELDPQAYLDALCACLDDLQASASLEGIEKVATSSQWHSVLALDAAREPVGPALTWLDTRAPVLAIPDDPADYHRRTGSWVHPLYWSTKIPWIARRSGRTRLSYTGITEYVRECLLGTTEISVSMASGSGMLEVATGRWDAEAVSLAGITVGQLPDLSDDRARLRPAFARRWPSLAAADWVAATGDGATSTIGAGCHDATSAGVTVGTSAAIRVVHPVIGAPELDQGLWRYRVDADRMLTGAAVSSGGVLHKWLHGLLGDVTEPVEPPGIASHGVSVIPMHAGSRPPVTMPAGSGVVAGLSLATRPVELVAATYEGVALELRRSLDLLDRSFGQPLSVVLGGGAVAASPWWRRVFAATFAREVGYLVHPEVGARGAALLALGLSADPPATVLPVEPDEAETMRTARDRFERVRARSV